MKPTPVVHLIAALDRRRAIGRGGGLPWHLPDDLRRFKALTLGHTVLMGRRTAESIGRALPGRRNLVWTSAATAPYPGQIAVRDLPEALALARDELYVVGGAKVYAAALPTAQFLHLTWVETEVVDADTHFPEPDWSDWDELGSAAYPADAHHPYAFRFVDYRRR